RIGVPRYCRCCQRLVPDLDRAAECREGERVVTRVVRRVVDALGARLQQIVIAEHDEPCAKRLRSLPLHQHRNELGTDAGRLAGRDRDRRMRAHHSGSTLTAEASPKTCTSTFSIARTASPAMRSTSIVA